MNTRSRLLISGNNAPKVVERAAPAAHAVDVPIGLVEQEVGEMRADHPGDARHECLGSRHRSPPRLIREIRTGQYRACAIVEVANCHRGSDGNPFDTAHLRYDQRMADSASAAGILPVLEAQSVPDLVHKAWGLSEVADPWITPGTAGGPARNAKQQRQRLVSCVNCKTCSGWRAFETDLQLTARRRYSIGRSTPKPPASGHRRRWWRCR